MPAVLVVQKDVNQPNKNIIFKTQANQEYNNNQMNYSQKSKLGKRLYWQS